jgi:mRNA-degrading endonuclease toxin of MazEF toxin-antitoxin module
MKLSRGDVVMTPFPHVSGARGKKRPALVVESN